MSYPFYIHTLRSGMYGGLHYFGSLSPIPTCHIHINIPILRDFAPLAGYLLICGYFDLVFKGSESKDPTDTTRDQRKTRWTRESQGIQIQFFLLS